jgi:hypothetical protein
MVWPMNLANGNSLGSSAASISTSIRDGGEGVCVPGNSWLFSAQAIQRSCNQD